MKELVLTGFRELWPENELDAVFLAPWCFAENHKYKFWEQKDFVIAPSPWKTPQDVLEASLYMDSLFDRVMPPLANLMNNFHRVKYSRRFWEIYMICWLLPWIGHCYDRYQRLKYIEQNIKENLSVKILNNKFPSAAKDYQDYSKKITQEHHYNLLLMSSIVQLGKFKSLVPQVFDIPNPIDEKREILESVRGYYPKAETGKKLIRFLKSTKTFLLAWKQNIALNSTTYLGSVYGMTFFDKLYFELSCDPFFIFKKRVAQKIVDKKRARDDFIKQPFEFVATNEFEDIVETMILGYVPDALLAIYKINRNEKQKTRIWIGMDIYLSEQKAYNIAATCENGGKWISAQHGGGYGQTYSFPDGKIEYETSDGFITWGWNHQHIYPSNYYPLPSPVLSKLPKHKEKNENIIFVSSMEPPFPKKFYCDVQPGEIIEYLENKKRFVIHLKDCIRAKIQYRPYFNEYGMGELEYADKTLSLKQFLIKNDITKELKISRLIVIDHRSTSFLKTFVMNTPTILFWTPEHFAVCTEATPYFNMLRTAGILFDTPEAAAKKINEIWNDVQGWWQQPEVRKAKDDFCYQFARTSKNWRKEWLIFLRTLK